MPLSAYKEPRSHIFLLRIWQERTPSSAQPAVWRFSLEDARTRQRRGFASLEDVTAFLQMRMAALEGRQEAPGGEEDSNTEGS